MQAKELRKQRTQLRHGNCIERELQTGNKRWRRLANRRESLQRIFWIFLIQRLPTMRNFPLL